MWTGNSCLPRPSRGQFWWTSLTWCRGGQRTSSSQRCACSNGWIQIRLRNREVCGGQDRHFQLFIVIVISDITISIIIIIIVITMITFIINFINLIIIVVIIIIIITTINTMIIIMIIIVTSSSSSSHHHHPHHHHHHRQHHSWSPPSSPEPLKSLLRILWSKLSFNCSSSRHADRSTELWSRKTKKNAEFPVDRSLSSLILTAMLRSFLWTVLASTLPSRRGNIWQRSIIAMSTPSSMKITTKVWNYHSYEHRAGHADNKKDVAKCCCLSSCEIFTDRT